MKKNLAVITIIFAICLLFTACSKTMHKEKAINLAGTTWKITGAQDDGKNEIPEEVLSDIYGEVTYIFENNGIVLCKAMGNTTQGTYTIDGEKVTILFDNAEAATAACSDKKMTLDNGKGYLFYLTKED